MGRRRNIQGNLKKRRLIYAIVAFDTRLQEPIGQVMIHITNTSENE